MVRSFRKCNWVKYAFHDLMSSSNSLNILIFKDVTSL